MSVPNTNYQTPFIGDGVTTSFGFAWAATSPEQVEVYIGGVLQVSGVTVTLSLVTLGGLITFNAAPALNAVGLIQRQSDLLQTDVSLQDNAPLPADTINAGFDKLTIISQQLQNQINNCVQADPSVGATATIPTPSIPSALFGWDATGKIVTQYTPQQVLANVPGSSAGNVVGPASAVSGNLAAYNSATGKLLKDSGIALSQVYSPANLPPAAGVTPQFRCYLVSNSPFADGASAGNTTIYVGPTGVGSTIVWDNGSGFLTATPLTETSLALGSSTTNKAYSVYLYNTGSTWVVEIDAWANTTTPPSYTYDGLGRFAKPGASNKLLVAEIYLAGTGTVFNYTGARHIQNIYNQYFVPILAQIAATSWAYATNTWRASDSNTTNGAGRISIFVGSVPVTVGIVFQSTVLVTVSDTCYAGIGVNSTTVPSSAAASGAIAQTITLTPSTFTSLPTGLNYLQMLEYGTGTFYGAGSNNISQLSGAIVQ